MRKLLVAAVLLGCRAKLDKIEERGPDVRLRAPGRTGGRRVLLRKEAGTFLEALVTGEDPEDPGPSRAPSLPPSLARETAAPASLPVPEKVSALPEIHLRHSNPLVRWWAAEAAGRARRKDLVRPLGRMIRARDVASSMAAWALGVIGESSGVPALAEGMFDKRPGLRLRCAAALCLIDGSRAVRALDSGLASEDYRIRAVCARELGRRGEALRTLSRLWRDSDEPAAVRVQAAAPFAARGDGDALRYIERLASGGGPASRALALRALAETSLEDAVVPVAAALDAREDEVWQEAGVALARLPREAVVRVLTALERAGSLRATAVLGALGRERAFDRLKHCYDCGDGGIRRFVCAALASCRDARAVALLAAATQADGLRLRLTAIRALGLRGDARAVEPLLKAASDDDPQVRMEAARALSRTPGERAHKALAALAKDPARGVRREAYFALSRRTAADSPGSPPASR